MQNDDNNYHPSRLLVIILVINKFVCSSNIEANKSYPLQWTANIVPENVPYNKGAFRIKITFPDLFPLLGPPDVVFLTRIYHPNIDEIGKMCPCCCYVDNWTPQNLARERIEKVIEIVDHPTCEKNAYRNDVHRDFVQDRNTIFVQKAENSRKSLLKSGLNFSIAYFVSYDASINEY